MMTDAPRYDAPDLVRFAADCLAAAGIPADKARTVAETLVEGDLMGHTTHGLALLQPYVGAALSGDMAGEGEPEILSDTGTIQVWDGRKLPGPWLVVRAAALAGQRAAASGLSAIAIRRSHHIACLAAYLPAAIARGQFLIVASSDPATASVAPFGGVRRLITPNPIAAGWPTGPDPDRGAMLDVSTSITTNGLVGRRRAEGMRFDAPWLLDGHGTPTNDPEAFFAEPLGSILPLGGVESGHKGFALGLLIEALTSALAGQGRADAPTGWGASVLVIAIDPARFGGLDAFTREAGWIADRIAEEPPLPGREQPRLPGARALALRRRQLAEGIVLHASIPPALALLAERFSIALPRTVNA